MWPNGWPDWHQLWCTHADSSRKGSWPKKISGGIGVRGWGGIGGHKFKSQKKAHVNTHAYSSTKGSRPIGGGGWGGGISRGSEIQKSEKAHVNTHTHMHIHLQRVVGQIKISHV